jgi:hypothetical protein
MSYRVFPLGRRGITRNTASPGIGRLTRAAVRIGETVTRRDVHQDERRQALPAPSRAAIKVSTACVSVPGVQTEGRALEVELLLVSPDAADTRDGAFAKRDRKICIVVVLRDARLVSARTAFAAADGFGRRRYLFLYIGRPDDLAADARAAVYFRERRSFG